MKTAPSLSRELSDLAMVLMNVIKAEFKADAGPGVPTLTQFRMLHFVRKGDGRVGRLAEEFGISQPAASIMVDAMVQEGLLTRTPHRADRRQIELRVTPKAAARVDAIRGRALAKIDARLSRLPLAGRKELAGRLREVARLLADPERETDA
jgi:DNA-binding MarR family transcriptional regulator